VVCVLFATAIFREIFVIDPLTGIYGVCVIFLIFTSFFFSYVRYRDPSKESISGDLKVKPASKRLLASIIIAAKNEPILLRDAVYGCLRSSYDNIEIFLVNDGSTDETGKVMDDLHRENPVKVKVIHIAKNVGKRKAIVEALKNGNIEGDIIILHDSDSIVSPTAIEKLMSVFSNPDAGAVTCYSRPLNGDVNTLTKMQDTWYHGSFNIFKGMESSFGSVTCCSGVLSAYRREAITPCLEAWSNDTFLGEEFRPGDDRQLTSYVIGGNKYYLGKQYRTWKTYYCESAHTLTEIPSTFRKFMNQQIRWKKSWVRVFIFTAPFYFRDRPLLSMAFYYIQMTLSLIGPIVTARNLIVLPLMGEYMPAIAYIAGILFIALLFALDFRFQNPKSGQRWVYRLLLPLLSVNILNFLVYYSMFTIKRKSWLTR
jgi:cellulose synthase/poly-beta-1,6-N-acetylglucosamine synthase-like glycosyltransferase